MSLDQELEMLSDIAMRHIKLRAQEDYEYDSQAAFLTVVLIKKMLQDLWSSVDETYFLKNLNRLIEEDLKDFV